MTTTTCQALSITNSWILLKLMSIELVMPSNHLILCHPLLLPSVFPSIRVFSNVSVLCIMWPKFWSFNYSISPSNEYSGLISFKMGFHGSSTGKESTCNAGDPSSIPGLGRSPGEGNSYPLQYSCLENSMDRGAWQVTIHGITIRHDWVTFTFTFNGYQLNF